MESSCCHSSVIFCGHAPFQSTQALSQVPLWLLAPLTAWHNPYGGTAFPHAHAASAHIMPKHVGEAAPGPRLRSLLQADQSCTVALEYSIVGAASSKFTSSLAVNNLSQAGSQSLNTPVSVNVLGCKKHPTSYHSPKSYVSLPLTQCFLQSAGCSGKLAAFLGVR